MNKTVKKLISAGLMLLVAISLNAASVTYVLNVGQRTNTIPGFAIVNGWTLSPNGTNTTVAFYDAPGILNTYSNTSYTTITQYATNATSTWVNFFGYTNSVTNLTLVTLTNTVAAVTNTYPNPFSASAVASTPTTVNNVDYAFVNGIMLTNTSAGIATITVNYTK